MSKEFEKTFAFYYKMCYNYKKINEDKVMVNTVLKTMICNIDG